MKKKLAAELHKQGYNCAQAVVCAFTEDLGIDTKTAFVLSEGMGRGAGDMQGYCGALSGAIMVAGIKNSDADLEAPKTKGSTYKITSQMRQDFQAEAGAVLCKDLKGVETGKMLCSCPRCIEIGVELVEKLLAK